MAGEAQPLDYKTRFGRHQEFFFISADVDRTNLAVVRVELHVQDEGLNNPNSAFLSVFAGSEALSQAGLDGFFYEASSGETNLCVGASRRYDNEKSLGIYTYTYEGLVADAPIYHEFELEFSMNQEPIETHPNFEVFEPKFGPYNPIDRVWPRVPTTAQSRAAGLPGGGQSAAQTVTNPMFGVSSFLSPGAVYRINYTASDVQEGDLDGIGTIDEPPFLSEEFPEFGQWMETNRRNWLKLAPK